MLVKIFDSYTPIRLRVINVQNIQPHTCAQQQQFSQIRMFQSLQLTQALEYEASMHV